MPKPKPAVASSVVASGAAVDQQAAQRDHEGLDAHLGDERAVDDADRKPAGNNDREGCNPVDVAIDDQIDEQDAEQCDHGADRQLDSADDDDEGFGNGEDTEQTDLIGGIGEIADEQEARIDEGDDSADDQDQDEQTQVFLVQGALA